MDELSEGAAGGSSQRRRTSLGQATIAYVDAAGILTQPSGFMSEYDFTLNPYSGCSFGCTYCYAAFFVRDEADQAAWGRWVRVKQNALELLRKRRRRPLTGKTIYMSSVTDPYQPIERELRLTRGLLEELADHHQPRLVIQTRSPLVTRDLDLLRRFEAVQVNMTITTDDEQVRKVFEPTCSSIQARLDAIAEVRASGIPTCITMTPLLPLGDPEAFALRLLATGVERYIVQPFHPEKGRFVAGTREEALRLCHERGWGPEAYQRALAVIARHIPQLAVGKDGFAPV